MDLGLVESTTAIHVPKARAMHHMGIGVLTPIVCAAGLARSWSARTVRLVALTMLSLLVAVTRFQRELWQGAGVAGRVLCSAELFQRDREVHDRLKAAALMVFWGLTLFAVSALEQASLMAALAFGTSWLLPADPTPSSSVSGRSS